MGTSSLAAALADLDDTRRRCPFGRWLDDLETDDPDYHKMVVTCLERIIENRQLNGRTSKGATAAWLVEHLNDDGHTFRRDSIADHIRVMLGGSGCRCQD